MNGQQAFERLAALCARGEHCEHDLREKMRRWDIDEQERDDVIRRLRDGKFIDDERYCRAFVRDKAGQNRWGRRKIEQALWLKRIPKDVVEAVMAETDDSSYVETLRPMLAQKRKTVKAASDFELRNKLFRWALSRGFAADVIRQCMDTTDISYDESDEMDGF